MFIAPRDITKNQARDTGMAMVLLALIGNYVTGKPVFIHVAVGTLVLDMVYPLLFRPLATAWLGLSHLLGTVMTKVLLTLLFFFVVTPIGSARRWLGSDPLKLKRWRSGDESVFDSRDHEYEAGDLESPF